MEQEKIILQKYEPLIYKVAKNFYNVELCDLYQAGSLGLIILGKPQSERAKFRWAWHDHDLEK